MTGLFVLLAVVDFWVGVILSILSGLGKIPVSFWPILVICGVIMIFLIVAIHFASIREYGNDDSEVEPKVIHFD